MTGFFRGFKVRKCNLVKNFAAQKIQTWFNSKKGKRGVFKVVKVTIRSMQREKAIIDARRKFFNESFRKLLDAKSGR
jgi:hypothetical protein